MPKLDLLRTIDAKRNGNGVTYITGNSPNLAPNPAPPIVHSGVSGQWYIGPSVLLMESVSSTDDSIVVADDYLLDIGDELVLSDGRGINEVATITGGPTAAGAYYRYTIARTDGRPFPAGATVTSLGGPEDGGYFIVNSGERGGAASKAPHMNVYQRDPAGDIPKLRLGKLANLPAALKAEFPGVDAEEWAAAGYGIAAAGSAYFAGKVWASGGEITGDLDVSGTLGVWSGLGRAGVVLGESEGGHGLVLQNKEGRPVFQVVSPYEDESGVLNEVAVIIEHEGERGLYYHKNTATGEYQLDIGVNTLVDGTLRATNILAGTGTYPGAFTGMRFGAEGLQTFGTDYLEQVAIDVQDGRLYFGKREGWLSENGMAIDTRGFAQGLDELEHTIHWIHNTSRTSDGGFIGASIGSMTGQLFMTVRRYVIDLYPGDVGAQAIDTFYESQLWLEPGPQNTSYLQSHNVELRGDATAAMTAGGSLNPAKAILTPDGRFTTNRLTVGGSSLHVTDDGQTVSAGTNSATGARLISLSDTLPNFQALRSDGQYFNVQVKRESETWLSASGAIALLPAPGADGVGRVLPYSNPVGLGSAARKFWEVYAERGHFGALGSQTALAGQFYLTHKHATLAVGLEAENVIAYIREGDLAVGEFYRFEDVDGNHETIRANTTGTLTGDGWYEYEVERAQGADVDNGTGIARQWEVGDVGVSLGGNALDGYIRLWGADDQNPNTGPAIVVYQRDNDDLPASVTERAVFGNLNGFYGYEDNYYGVAFGKSAAQWVALDEANGLRIMDATTQRAVYREYAQIGNPLANNVLITDSTLQLGTGDTYTITMDAAGDMDLTGTLAVATGGAITWAGGKGRADSTGLEHVEDVDNYWTVKPNSDTLMRLNTNIAHSYAAIYLQAVNTGVYAQVTSTFAAVKGESVHVSGGIGVFGSGSSYGISGAAGITGTGVYGIGKHGLHGRTTAASGYGVIATATKEVYPGTTPSGALLVTGDSADNVPSIVIADGIVNGGSQRYTNLADATADTDALNRQTGDGRYSTLANGRRWRRWFQA